MKCAICGKESKNSICAKCYSEKFDVVSLDCVNITVCPKCGHYKLSGKWKRVSFDDALKESIEKHIELHPELKICKVNLEYNNKEGVLKIEGELWGEKVEIEKFFSIKIEKILCEKCSMISGGYYESIIQIRGKMSEKEFKEVKSAVEDIVEDVLKSEKENLKAFVTKVVERKGGFDIYMGGRDVGKKISRMIAEKFGCKIKESKKIAGRRDGRDVHRFTYSVRFPDYRSGDVVVENGKLIYVTNSKLGKGLRLPDLKSVNLKDCKVVVKAEEIKESVVVNSDDYVVEVIDPETGRVLPAEKCGRLNIGDKVYTFKHMDKIYVIPEYVKK